MAKLINRQVDLLYTGFGFVELSRFGCPGGMELFGGLFHRIRHGHAEIRKAENDDPSFLNITQLIVIITMAEKTTGVPSVISNGMVCALRTWLDVHSAIKKSKGIF